MIARTGVSTPDALNVNVDVNVQGLEEMTEALMLLLNRNALPAPEAGGETIQRPLFPEASESGEEQPSVTVLPVAEKAPPPPVDDSPKPAKLPSVTLLGFYNEFMRPRKMRSGGLDAVKDAQTSADQFDEWMLLEKEHRITYPVLLALANDAGLFGRFAKYRFVQHKNAVTTVQRRLMHVNMIAEAMLRAGKLDRIACDKVTPKELKAMRRKCCTVSDEDQRKIPSVEEIDLLARNVDVATYPYGKHAPYFWRGWIRYCALYGPRTRDLVSPITSKMGLRKQDVIWDTLCPVSDVNHALGYDLHSPHGWLWYYVGKDHTSDSPRVLFPMPQWLRSWLRFFVELTPNPVRVFPGTRKNSWLTQFSLTKQWRRIIASAGVDQRIVLSEGKGGKIAIRKQAVNWWEQQVTNQKGDAALAEKVAFYVLHHAEVTTKNKHYVNAQAKALPVILELLPSFPLPAADAPAVSLLPE